MDGYLCLCDQDNCTKKHTVLSSTNSDNPMHIAMSVQCIYSLFFPLQVKNKQINQLMEFTNMCFFLGTDGMDVNDNYVRYLHISNTNGFNLWPKSEKKTVWRDFPGKHYADLSSPTVFVLLLLRV